MRLMILAACAALLTLAAAPAEGAQHPDDRYFDSRAQVAPQKVIRKVVHQKVKWGRHHRRHSRESVSRAGGTHVDTGSVRFLRPAMTYHPHLSGDESPLEGAARETIQDTPRSVLIPAVSGPRPRPRAWCGWFMGKLVGLHDRALWLARNWAHVGAPAGKHVGAIVVWRHHVGKITAVRADGAIRVLSGNDGRAVRDRWRSSAGVIAYRAL